MCSAVTPTAEQRAIVDACMSGQNVVIEAGAGTGKTSTMRMVATAMGAYSRRGLYVAYNRSIARDSAGTFPRDVQCSTAHALAYRAVGSRYRDRLNGPRQTAYQAAKIMRIERPIPLASRELFVPPHQFARIVLDTVGRFCHTADTEITRAHVPHIEGIIDANDAALREQVLPWAQKVWIDYRHPRGKLKVSHDAYLKDWALSSPRLDVDYIMLDEGQDANPVIADLIQQQQCQQIAVGDRAQSLYAWRGAVDALGTWPAHTRLLLSQSWRFGPVIAAEANRWLSLLNTPLRLSGAPHQASRITELDAPHAVLCRTNAEAIRQVMDATAAGRRAALVGGGQQIRRMAEAAQDLKAGRGTSHPELFAFPSWGAVQDYVNHETSGSDLKVFVDLIDQHGPATVITTVDALVDEPDADVIVSTVHKAKGREWSSVAIGADFHAPKRDDDGEFGDPDPAEVMLAYVAVTRARGLLDRGSLSWVDDYVPAQAVAA